MRKLFSILGALLLCTVVWTTANAETQRVYCSMTQSWWTADAAAVAAYAWTDGVDPNAAWPGVRMNAVAGEDGLWYIDLDTKYKKVIFTRVNASGTIADWGAKTQDQTIPTDGKDLFTITSSSAVWGDPGCVGSWSAQSPKLMAVLDLSGATDWGIPTYGSDNKGPETYTVNGYGITLAAQTNYKQNSGYLLIGKSGSTVTFPAFTWKTTKISVSGSSSASEAVKQNIFVGDDAVSTETTGAKNVTNKYEISESKQAAGTIYQLKVTSAANTQISKIQIFGVAADAPVAPKYYITGNEALLGKGNAWDPEKAIAATADSYKFEALPAGDYQLLVLLDKNWTNKKGFSDLTGEAPAGVTTDKDNNINFTLAKAGDVTITFNAAKFEIAGEFYVEPVVMEDIKFVPGVWNEAGAKFAAWTWSKDLSYQSWTGFFAGSGDTLSVKVNAKADSIVFVRLNSDATEPSWDKKWNDVKDSIDYVGKTFTITDWNKGQWEPYVAPVAAKYYITGNEALLGKGNAWNLEKAIAVTADSYTFEALPAGAYSLKVLTALDWSSAKGFSDLTGEAPAGVTTDKDNNINFTLAKAGDVTITYTAASFTIAGNFYVVPVVAQYGLLVNGTDFIEATVNPENDQELMALNVALTSGQKFVLYDNVNKAGWVIPNWNEGSYQFAIVKDGENDVYSVTESGVYDFYVHAEYEISKSYIYVAKQTGAGCENIYGNGTELRKVIENGVMYIYRDGKKYSVQGLLVE